MCSRQVITACLCQARAAAPLPKVIAKRKPTKRIKMIAKMTAFIRGTSQLCQVVSTVMI